MVAWNEENTAKLMACILVVCEVKISEKQKAEVAEMMGMGCSARAVHHRLAALRKAAAASSVTLSGDTAVAEEEENVGSVKNKKEKATPKMTTTPASSKKKVTVPAFKGKATDHAHPSPVDDTGDRMEKLQLMPPTSSEKKRKGGEGFKVEGLDDGEDLIAVGEDVGQGFRKKKKKKVKVEMEDEDDDEML